MVLCDTNIFISAFNGRSETINQLDKIGFAEIVLSAITVMELFQGMGNKNELAQMKKKIRFYAIIGATAVIHQIPLYTYNLKDFDFLPGILLYQPV